MFVTFVESCLRVHAASVSPEMVTFFGIIQNLFVFFSSSAHRWDIRKSHLPISLKRHCDTRWSYKKQVVSAVYKHSETYSGAKNYINKLKVFTLFAVW